MTPTIFDNPQATFELDRQGARWYANIDNRLEVSQRERPAFHVPIAVPSVLFTLCLETLKVARDDTVSLSLDEVEPDKFVFSLVYAQDTKIADLWTLSRKALPGFLLNRKYRL